jgi:hypothetical protein
MGHEPQGQTLSGFDPDTSLPAQRHFTRLLRRMPNTALQFLLASSVTAILRALAAAQCTTHLTYIDRTVTLVKHQRGKYVCPLQAQDAPSDAVCPIDHERWPKGGCKTTMPTSVGARLRYTLDRECEAYQDAYRQRTATERINSQAVALGIERPHLRNGQAIANRNTLIYTLINLRFLKRLHDRQITDP